jgi:hypothetical protein
VDGPGSSGFASNDVRRFGGTDRRAVHYTTGDNTVGEGPRGRPLATARGFHRERRADPGVRREPARQRQLVPLYSVLFVCLLVARPRQRLGSSHPTF